MRRTERSKRTRRRDIRDAIAVILESPALSELRALGTPQGVASGYFDDSDALADAAARWSGEGIGVYITLNPVIPELLARAANRVKPYAKHTTSERDILRLRHLLIDFDPVRRSGISSTDQEHRAGQLRAGRVWLWLRDLSWPEPLIADSGNGAHLLYGVDLPNDEPSRRLLGRCLQALNLLFSDDQVLVDLTTAKAAQLWKLPGTLACKGDDLPDRPHRLAVLLQCPDPLRTVTRAQLEHLAVMVPIPPQPAVRASSSWEFDLNNWIEEHRLPVVAVGDWNGGQKWILSPCPWNADHTDRAAYIVRFPNGAIAAGCHHNACAGKDWQALRDLVEPDRGGSRPGRSYSGDIGKSENQGGQVEPWQPPVPFYEFKLPNFPTHAFPDPLRDYVEESATATQTPVDLPAMVVLGVLSAACATTVEVEVKPDYVEPVNLYTVVSMSPGNRKSAVFRDAVGPLEAFERAENRRRVGDIMAAEARHEMATKQLEKAQAAVAKASTADRDALEREVKKCAAQLATIRIPSLCRLLADDITSESLASRLAEQSGRVAVMSPEGDIFDIMAGRYGTGGPNLMVFLKGHSGESIRVDRIGRPAEYVERPALTISLTVQPEVLRGLTRRSEFRGRGLLGRILYALPESLMGRRDIDPPPMRPSVRTAYSRTIEALLELSSGGDSREDPEPRKLQLSRTAREILRNFEGWLEPKLGPEGTLASMTDWAGKLIGAVARIAGLLHMAEHAHEQDPWDIAIQRGTLKRAIEIGHYLIAHAQAAYAEMGADPEVEAARGLLAWIITRGKSTFTLRELFQGTKGRFKKVAALRPALTILIEHGHIRQQVPPAHPGPGRKPSEAFTVNPYLWSQNSHNPQIGPARH